MRDVLNEIDRIITQIRCMKDFSLDLESERIHSRKVKEYFKEILESYYNRNYRATVVMLYSVVVCDLIYKLQELKDIYNDKKAINVLDEIEETQRKNPKSPDWENQLFDLIAERTSLFAISTYENIKIIQKHRHLCAHPIMDTEYELFSPNRETTRSHLRNMLEDLFTKRPFVSKDVFSEMIVDIAEKREYFPPKYDNIELERYLITKYLSNSPKSTIEYIFKNLWKFTFRLRNDECNLNRDINYNALFILFRKYRTDFINLIKDERSYYSKIEKGNPCQFLISFISLFPEIYDHIEEHAKIMIQKEAAKTTHYKIRAWYLASSVEAHLEEIKKEYENEQIDFYENEYNQKAIFFLIRETQDLPANEEIINFAIDFYVKSRSYSSANWNFESFILPNLQYMRLNNFEYLLSGIEKNKQTFNRGKSYNDHNIILEHITANYKEINFDSYPNFKKSITTKKNQDDDDDLPF